MANSKPRLKELDALRGIAAMSVCLFHYGFYKNGYTGVNLFFMISGYVIFMSIKSTNSLAEFWKARILRLFPLYYLSIIIALLFCANCFFDYQTFHLNDLLGNVLMLQPIFKAKYLAFIYWTLYVEVIFYVYMSVIWKLKLLKHIEKVIIYTYAIMAVLMITYISNGIDSHTGITRAFIIFDGVFPLLDHFQMFASGIIFYQIYNFGINKERFVILVISLLFVPISLYYHGRLANTSYLYYGSIIIYFSIFWLIVNHKKTHLKYKAMIFLGEVSYALYLIHGTFGMWVHDQLLLRLGTNLAWILAVITSILLATVMTFYYDLPLRRWINKDKKKLVY